MPLVFIDDLSAGMILAEDLLTPSGRFVLAAGATLSSEHLGLLKRWGVLEADIDESSLGEQYHQSQLSEREVNLQAEAFLQRRLVGNALDTELMEAIYRHGVHHHAMQIKRGNLPQLLEDKVDGTAECPASPVNMALLLKGDIEVVSLPTVYSRINQLIHEPDTSASRLGEAISKDPSLTIRLLRLVNSPFYGFSGKVESVSRAVSLIGFNELSSLALGITVVRHFESIPSQLLDMESFWRHSIRCGLFARALAAHCGEKENERYFTGGLLHDIGRLVLLDRVPEAYQQAVLCGRQKRLPMYRAELEVLKTDHCIIGRLLAEEWRLSPSLIRMIGSHHSPRMSRYARDACLVHVADFLAHICGESALLVNDMPHFQERAWEELNLSPHVVGAAMERVEKEYRGIVSSFFAD